jgi:mannose-6-phosphate isomerase-like protein (cupin superfamily)
MLKSMQLIDLTQKAGTLSGKYENVIISRNNDHGLRMSRMTELYFWHFHPNSDETFIGVEGSLILELENQRVELGPGQVFTVPKGSKHRTSPSGSCSVNLTLERADIETVRVGCGPPGRTHCSARHVSKALS